MTSRGRGRPRRATNVEESESPRGQAGIEDALRVMTQILGRMDRGREPLFFCRKLFLKQNSVARPCREKGNQQWQE